MPTTFKTRVTELLDSKGIKYRLLSHDKEVFTCEEAAKIRGVVLEEMVKCILLIDKDNKYVLAALLADKKLDPRKAAESAGTKRLSFATKEQIKEVLGYTMGAVPPFVFDADVKVVFDDEVIKKERISISSGDTRSGLELSPKDLIGLIKPIRGDIKKD
ncbi:hypothetical protein COV19_03760 [Candidatus Woesearchaeota archaeon CG10_big_fil_rev_8_21_14_0_10_44_13]|nr:MAG: hypothetical protein COV19_03760 [Candidatus Woesearchaeota archaeon CG10_big_fil_rev_8_21_14_0_10_44_13]